MLDVRTKINWIGEGRWTVTEASRVEKQPYDETSGPAMDKILTVT